VPYTNKVLEVLPGLGTIIPFGFGQHIQRHIT